MFLSARQEVPDTHYLGAVMPAPRWAIGGDVTQMQEDTLVEASRRHGLRLHVADQVVLGMDAELSSQG